MGFNGADGAWSGTVSTPLLPDQARLSLAIRPSSEAFQVDREAQCGMTSTKRQTVFGYGCVDAYRGSVARDMLISSSASILVALCIGLCARREAWVRHPLRTVSCGFEGVGGGERGQAFGVLIHRASDSAGTRGGAKPDRAEPSRVASIAGPDVPIRQVCVWRWTSVGFSSRDCSLVAD